MSREIYFKIKSSREMASNSDEGIASDTVESLTDVQFRQNFNFMRISGEMCDVNITVEDISFKAHKLILAGCSPYFRCMFGKKKFTEENMDDVAIDPERQLGIKASAVEQLIEYMYTGYMDFELGNIIDLIWASDLFQLPEIKEQGLDKLEQHIDFLTYMDISEVGMVFARPKLTKAVDRFIRANFDDFVYTPAFLELSLEELSKYLKNKNLQMKDEETVLKSVLKWCKNNQKSEEFRHLIEFIQFDLISVRTICTTLKDDDVFLNSREMTNLVLEKMQKIANPLVTSRPRFSSHTFIAIPYKSKCFFAITFYGKDSIDFETKNFPESVGDHLIPLTNYGICHFDNYVYIAGGSTFAPNEAYNTEKGFLYHIRQNTWTPGPSLPSEAFGFGLTALNQKIYFVKSDEGPGLATNTEMYDLDNPNAGWITVAEMNYRRAQVHLIVCNGLIYALGGMENGGYTSTVEVLDPLTEIWTEVDSMTQARCNPGVAVANGRIYVVGGLGDNLLGPPGALKSAEFYDPITDTWTSLPEMYFPRHSPAVVVKNNKLYAFGGGSPSPLLRPGPERTIEVYDFNTNEWFVYPEKIPGRSNAIYVGAFFNDLEIE